MVDDTAPTLHPPEVSDLGNAPIPLSLCGVGSIHHVVGKISGWGFLYDSARQEWRATYPDAAWPFGARRPPSPSDIDWLTVARPDPKRWTLTDIKKDPISPNQVGRAPYHWLTMQQMATPFAFNTESLTWVPIVGERATSPDTSQRKGRKSNSPGLNPLDRGIRRARRYIQADTPKRRAVIAYLQCGVRAILPKSRLTATVVAMIVFGLLLATAWGRGILGLLGIAFWIWFAIGLRSGKGAGEFNFLDTFAIYFLISLGLIPILVVVMTICMVLLII